MLKASILTENTISILALALCLAPGILHSVEVAYPLLARWLANYVLPFFEAGLPKGSSKNLTRNEQIVMLDAVLSAAPKEKKTAAADYIIGKPKSRYL